jgi:hypothetical protein
MQEHAAVSAQEHAAHVHFEQEGTRLTAIEIGRKGRLPVISSLHHALFALGIIVSSYHLRRTDTDGLVERVVLEREDGGDIEGDLSDATKAAVLPIALR